MIGCIALSALTVLPRKKTYSRESAGRLGSFFTAFLDSCVLFFTWLLSDPSFPVCVRLVDPFHHPFPNLLVSVFLNSEAVKEPLLLRGRGPVVLSETGGL